MPLEPAVRQNAIEAFERRAAQRIQETTLTVFVCGPADVDENGNPSTRPGAVVRRTISKRVQQSGHTSVWGEHLTPREGGGTSLVRRFNDAHKEIIFAVDDETDLVVIFPSSQGSLAELGIFCTHQKISPKLLVVLPSECKKNKSFVAGPLRRAGQMGNAIIKFRNYEHLGSVWKVVRSEIDRRRELKAVRLTHG